MVKTIYHTVLKTLLLNYKEPEKPSLFTGTSWCNSSKHWRDNNSAVIIKLVTKLCGLSDKVKASSIRNKLPEVKVLMMDEVSMVSSDLWSEIDARLSEIFLLSIELPFAGLSVVVIGDYI